MSQMMICEHCQGSGWVRARSNAPHTNLFESSAQALALGGNSGRPFSKPGMPTSKPGMPVSRPMSMGGLSPGESRKSFTYRERSMVDVWPSLAWAAVSGGFAGVAGGFVCLVFHWPWFVAPAIWIGGTALSWFVVSLDFLNDEKLVVSKQEVTRPQMQAPPAPAAPPSAEIVIQTGTTQKRAKLQAPRTNHAGLHQYADALVRGIAAPSYTGGKGKAGVFGANAYGYTPGEFDGRSDCWRPTAIAAGILEKDPHKSKGYRLTDSGRRALARVAEHRLGEWG